MVANVDREAPITDLIEGHPALVLVCCALLAGPSCGDHSPAQMADTGVCAVEPPPAVLDADALSARLASALEEHSAAVVVQDDVLGEGPDGWDSDPRYPKNSTNCITWVQQVISSAYADTPSSRRVGRGRCGRASSRRGSLGILLLDHPSRGTLETLSGCRSV